MKVLWICSFSNQTVRDNLKLGSKSLESLLRRVTKQTSAIYSDYAPWISNAIKEFENIDKAELHIVSPQFGMKKKNQSFSIKGVTYHFFKPDDDSWKRKIEKYITKRMDSEFLGNRSFIRKMIEEIQPDIIHLYGAENPYYSISALDIDINEYPLFVSLQTIMLTPEFKEKVDIKDISKYKFRSNIEEKILKYSRYIGSSHIPYRKFVWNTIDKSKYIFKDYLALEQQIMLQNKRKKYDFVYFSADISKAVDIAIESFSLTCKKYPNLILNIIGGSQPEYKSKLEEKVIELGIKNNVIFSGRLPAHNDVLDQIQLSKYALLPLKTDMVAGTIREAMLAKLPVVSTITPGTPSLNEKRKSILLSEQDDYQAIANNMIDLIEKPELADELIVNGFKTVNELWNNEKDMIELVEVYNAIINHHKNGIEIPDKFNTKNPNI